MDWTGFKKEVYKLTTIDLDAYKEKQMKRRIDSLIAEHSVPSYDEYAKKLSSDKDYFEEFVNFLTINVSEFYRNPPQWKVLEEEMLPELMNKFGNRLKIWSAACSTGDEPYTLVMVLADHIPMSNIKIIATDIDNVVLSKAQAGLYNKKSVAGLPQKYIDKYFTKIGDNSYKISDEVKKCVEFKKHDLLKDPYPKDCHMIVCRNVLIYFTDECKNDIFKKFNQSLVKEGILFVGSTEQMMQCKTLNYDSKRSFFYQKIQ